MSLLLSLCLCDHILFYLIINALVINPVAMENVLLISDSCFVTKAVKTQSISKSDGMTITGIHYSFFLKYLCHILFEWERGLGQRESLVDTNLQ